MEMNRFVISDDILVRILDDINKIINRESTHKHTHKNDMFSECEKIIRNITFNTTEHL